MNEEVHSTQSQQQEPEQKTTAPDKAKWLDEVVAGMKDGFNESLVGEKVGVRERSKSFVLFFRTFNNLRFVVGGSILQQIYEICLFLSVLAAILNIFSEDRNLDTILLFLVVVPVALKLVFERLTLTYIMHDNLQTIRKKLEAKGD